MYTKETSVLDHSTEYVLTSMQYQREQTTTYGHYYYVHLLAETADAMTDTALFQQALKGFHRM